MVRCENRGEIEKPLLVEDEMDACATDECRKHSGGKEMKLGKEKRCGQYAPYKSVLNFVRLTSIHPFTHTHSIVSFGTRDTLVSSASVISLSLSLPRTVASIWWRIGSRTLFLSFEFCTLYNVFQFYSSPSSPTSLSFPTHFSDRLRQLRAPSRKYLMHR